MKPRHLGLIMIITGAGLWGLSGPLIQWFFQQTGQSSSNFLVIRLLSAGILILGTLFLRKEDIFRIWKHPRHLVQLLIFGIAGMLGAQYAFMDTIQVSNAVTATLFQFLGPVLITIFVAIESKKLPSLIHFLAIIAAVAGIYFLITNGSTDNIVLSEKAILLGILTALGFAFYTLHPKSLITDWGTLVILGWGMLIGGITLYIFNPQFTISSFARTLTTPTFFMLLAIILIGTLSYALYIGSLKYLSPVETGLLSIIEPLVAAIVSLIWLKETFGSFQLFGGALIIIAVVFLALPEKEQVQEVPAKALDA